MDRVVSGYAGAQGVGAPDASRFYYHPHDGEDPAMAYLPVDWKRTALNAAEGSPYLALADKEFSKRARYVRRPSVVLYQPSGRDNEPERTMASRCRIAFVQSCDIISRLRATQCCQKLPTC